MLKLILAGFILLHLSSSLSLVTAAGRSRTRPANTWKTLSGTMPLVVAKGGFSGLLPESSQLSYQLVPLVSFPSTVEWCDVRLTKDAVGVCIHDLNLANSTNIATIFPNKAQIYSVNGVSVKGYFSVDYTSSVLLNNVSLVQGIYSRTNAFDFQPILPVEVVQSLNPASLWLNVQHDIFYTQHNLSMRSYIISISRKGTVNYISSPEFGFLRSIAARFKRSRTKLIFRFLDQSSTDPSTNLTYGSVLKNLTSVKEVVSGILVPKSYIWPTDSNQYLSAATTLVQDAHKIQLEVFASDFANDAPSSYNYSYDPVVEYLSFVTNNPGFSVDGVLTDFPVTASAAIGCYAQSGNGTSGQGKTLVISSGGSSGIYASNTDLAYQQAIKDGVDIIDCAVQMTKDGIPICFNTADLSLGTNVAVSPFANLSTTISEIQRLPGYFTFQLSWEEIQTLKPVLQSPAQDRGLLRNPAFQNQGRFMTLSDFLNYTKAQTISGILINIDNADYLARNQGLDVIGAVTGALSDAGYGNGTKLEVFIQSKDSAVLIKLKQQTSYKLVYKIDEVISTINNKALQNIKSFSYAVALDKASIITGNDYSSLASTDVVKKVHSAKLSAYVYTLQNEFTTIYQDFFSDPRTQIAAFVGLGVDGLITEFPATAKSYLNNACSNVTNPPGPPPYIQPPEPGALLHALTNALNVPMPPAGAPSPPLKEEDVSEPPLSPVVPKKPTGGGGSPAPTSSPPSDAPRTSSFSLILCITMLLLSYAVSS